MAGGTLEMARNVVSERLLGMPREITIDREVPFRDVLGTGGSLVRRAIAMSSPPSDGGPAVLNRG